MTASSHIRIPLAWCRPDILAASFGINLLGLALPIVILQVYDRILPNAATGTFTVLMLMLAGVVVLEAVLRVLRSYIMSWSGARFEHQLGTDAFTRMLRADVVRFEMEAPGAYLDKLQGIDSLREYYSGQAAATVVDTPFILLFLILIWMIGGNLVLIPIGLLVVFVAVSWWIGQRLHAAIERRASMDDRRYNFMIEALSSVHTVKSMAMEPLMLRRYERLQAQSAESVVEMSQLASMSQGLSQAFGQISMAAVVSVGCLGVVDNTLTVGALAASTMLTGRALQPTLRAMAMWNQYQSIRLARRRMGEILALPEEAPGQRSDPDTLTGRIRVEGVAFQYAQAGEPVLDGVDLDVGVGEAVGITGDNGVGKSTLLAVMAGLLRPTRGRVLVDGQDLADVDPAALRRQIAFMPQSGSLFQGTLLDNLTMFRDDESVEQAIDIAEQLGLDDVITRMPRGLETRLGDSAVETIPDGVRQRIVMVRALVGQPPVILFDDANAALDQQSDAALRGLLARLKGSRTMVIVSHRPSLLRLCDRLYRIADGRLSACAVPEYAAPIPGPTPIAASAGKPIGAFAAAPMPIGDAAVGVPSRVQAAE